MKKTSKKNAYYSLRIKRSYWRIGGLASLAFTILAIASFQAYNAQQARALTPGAGAPTPVYRWWNNGDRDWVSVPTHGGQTSDATLAQWYSKSTTPQYYVSMIGTADPNMVAVYRWWHSADRDWVDLRDGVTPDATLKSWGYSKKTFQYYAYTTNDNGRVAVNRWWHARDRDWITLRQDEITDAKMSSMGYTGKTLLVYASPVKSPTNENGYFNLSAPQSSVVPTPMGTGTGYYPHTMSVLDVNPALDPALNKGQRYLGYMGHNECGTPQGIYLARTNDLNTPKWEQDPVPPTFVGTPPCRWASALVDGPNVALVVNQVWDKTITGQVSTDGLNGTKFTPPVTLVSEPNVQNGNPTLFRDPGTGKFHLYWYRVNRSVSPAVFEIRVKSSPTFAGLIGGGPTDIGKLIARSPETVAAPQVMFANGSYYLAVETYEGEPSKQLWKTRVLTSATPDGLFYEIPGNPVYEPGVACVFQHVVENTLHSYYCKMNIPGNSQTWSLDHVTADLTKPN